MIFFIGIFSPCPPVAQINKKSLGSLYHCQTSQISRKLFYFPMYYFSTYQITVTSVVDWFHLALVPEMDVNTRHPGDFLSSLTKKNGYLYWIPQLNISTWKRHSCEQLVPFSTGSRDGCEYTPVKHLNISTWKRHSCEQIHIRVSHLHILSHC